MKEMTNEKIVISKSDIVINKELEYKSRCYYTVADRSITGKMSILSESNKLHEFSAKDINELFITKLDKCFMYEGYDYYNTDDKYYKLAYGGNSKEEITFEEYMNASVKWEFYKIS